MRLYSAPRTRALRIAWLLEELTLPYELIQVEFQPTSSSFFIQKTPTGKIPTLEDGDLVMSESGAISQYILAKHGHGELAPAVDNATYPDFLRWFHFAESTAFAPIGVVVWLTIYRQDAAAHPALVEDARIRAITTLRQVEDHLQDRDYLIGEQFSAADIMMGFTLLAGGLLGLTDNMPNLAAYLQRLQARPAYAVAADKVGGF